MHLVARGFDGEKVRTIDFGKLLLLSRVGRPFDRKRVAGKRRGIAVAFKGPGRDVFPSLVAHAAEIDEGPARLKAGFFFEFALRGFRFVFARADFTFGDEPGARVFFLPVRATGMHEQNFEVAVAKAVHHQSRAPLRHDATITPARTQTAETRRKTEQQHAYDKERNCARLKAAATKANRDSLGMTTNG